MNTGCRRAAIADRLPVTMAVRPVHRPMTWVVPQDPLQNNNNDAIQGVFQTRSERIV